MFILKLRSFIFRSKHLHHQKIINCKKKYFAYMLNLKLAILATTHILLVGGSTKSISVYPHGMGKKQPTYLSSSIVEKIDLYLFTKRWKKKKLLLKVYMMQKNILLRIIWICTMTKSFFFTSSFACIWWWALPHNFVCDDTFHRFPQRLKIHDNKTFFFFRSLFYWKISFEPLRAYILYPYIPIITRGRGTYSISCKWLSSTNCLCLEYSNFKYISNMPCSKISN